MFPSVIRLFTAGVKGQTRTLTQEAGAVLKYCQFSVEVGVVVLCSVHHDFLQAAVTHNSFLCVDPLIMIQAS